MASTCTNNQSVKNNLVDAHDDAPINLSYTSEEDSQATCEPYNIDGPKQRLSSPSTVNMEDTCPGDGKEAPSLSIWPAVTLFQQASVTTSPALEAGSNQGTDATTQSPATTSSSHSETSDMENCSAGESMSFSVTHVVVVQCVLVRIPVTLPLVDSLLPR